MLHSAVLLDTDLDDILADDLMEATDRSASGGHREKDIESKGASSATYLPPDFFEHLYAW
jgi:hypothetical protein